MSNKVLGIHHITAIAGDPQENVDFYVGILGLRFVKKTINFDDPFTYHLYFGNETGQPGTILTFFPWTSMGVKGHPGTGQLTVISFSVPDGSFGFWTQHLKKHDVEFKGPFSRLDEEGLILYDPDGLELELVSSANDPRPAWGKGAVPEQYAIRGFYHVALAEERYERTAGLLTETLGFRKVTESGSRFRYEVAGGGPGAMVDIVCEPDAAPGRMGVGAVHHIAWRTSDQENQLTLRQQLVDLSYNVTPVIDRNYFHSIYFKEPGQILFEIATDPPGFTIDEDIGTLGTSLKLPPWLENNRPEIEQALPPIAVPYLD